MDSRRRPPRADAFLGPAARSSSSAMWRRATAVDSQSSASTARRTASTRCATWLGRSRDRCPLRILPSGSPRRRPSPSLAGPPSLQLVFADLSTPSDRWNAYDQLRHELTARAGRPGRSVSSTRGRERQGQSRAVLSAPVKVQELQNKLYQAAKQSPTRRFHALYDKIHREDLLWAPRVAVARNNGAPGVDGVSPVQPELDDHFAHQATFDLDQSVRVTGQRQPQV